ncbi:MAG: ABC transporter substrate-binding protein [Candidatus Limnocylindrales bacterium]
MYKQLSRPGKALGLLGAAALVFTACSSTATTPSPAATQTPAATPAPVATPAPSVVNITPAPIPAGPGPNGGTVVRWFIGLGAGTQPAQIAPEQAFAAAYNGSQKDVYLSLEIVDNTQAANILKTEVASGTAPDIIGPVGVEGLNIFRDQLLDLAPIIAKDNYKFNGVDQSLVDFFKLGLNGATVGVPFAVYPSFIFYNKDLFKEAGLPDLPTKVGDQYQGKPWDIDNLRSVAMKLTVDKAGNDATSAKFDPTTIVQWGFDSQYQDNSARAEDSFFGAGSFLADDGKTAQIPDYVAAGEKWFNDGVWKDHFIPTTAQINSALLGAGGEFGSGNLAMDEGHTWFTCCVAPPKGTKQFNFGFAIMPTVNGKITSPLHADTFSIMKTTKVPDAAWTALKAMVASADLLTTYGAMPADKTKQKAWEATIDKGFPGIKLDWSVPEQMLAYPDVPNHQSWMPDYAKAKAALQAFQNKYRTASGVDITAELATLKTTLQGIFDAAPKS